MSHFTGKVALVTGAGSGIGRATALEFAAHGASVVVVDIKPDTGAETARSIEQAGGKAMFVGADVADEASVKMMVEAVSGAYSRLDCLVNNAGIAAPYPRPPLHEIPVEEFTAVMSVNVTGTFLCMKHAIPLMLKSGGGAVVNLSSTFGERASAQDPAYTASKHAVRGLTKSAALVYAEQGVRVNCIGPAVVKTAMTAHITGDSKVAQARLAATPMRRFAEPVEIARLILFLCSDDAAYITGAYYPIDGGQLAG